MDSILEEKRVPYKQVPKVGYTMKRPGGNSFPMVYCANRLRAYVNSICINNNVQYVNPGLGSGVLVTPEINTVASLGVAFSFSSLIAPRVGTEDNMKYVKDWKDPRANDQTQWNLPRSYTDPSVPSVITKAYLSGGIVPKMVSICELQPKTNSDTPGGATTSVDLFPHVKVDTEIPIDLRETTS